MSVLCACDDVAKGKARGFELHGNKYIVVHTPPDFYVYLNRCPHLHIPLEWEADNFLDSEGELIRCSTHGALFIIQTGECVAGPCVGQSLTSVPFSITDGQIHLVPATPESPVPE